MRGRSITRRRRTAALISAVGIGTALLLAPGAATAAPQQSRSATADTAVIRGAHLSPDTPGVDVYLTAFKGGESHLWLSDLGYGDFSGYHRVPAGLYAVSMRAHGASAKTPPALRWTLDAAAGHAYTVAAVGMNSHIRGIVLHDNLTAAPDGRGRVRVIQAANRASTADVVAKPHFVVARKTKFATATGYTSVPAGRWTVQARSATSPNASTSSVVHVRSGSVESLVLLDSSTHGLVLRTVVDAVGAAKAPRGSIDAGGGGTAPRPPGDDIAGWLALVSVGGLGVLALGLARRRQLFARAGGR